MSLSRLQTLRNIRERSTLLCLRLAGTQVQPNLQSQIGSSRIQTLSARKLLIPVGAAPRWPANTENLFATYATRMGKDADTLEDDDANLELTSENNYARGVVTNSKKYPEAIALPLKNEATILDEEVKEILSRDWLKSEGTEILNDFRILSCHAKLNSLCLGQEKYGVILSQLSEKLHEFDDKELQQVFQCLALWQRIRSTTCPDYETLWMKMDEECGKREANWSQEKKLLFADYWCQLFLARKSRYFRLMMRALTKNPRKLTPMNYLHLMFLVNLSRVRPDNFYEMEYHLDRILDAFTVNEIGVICMAFFKNKTPFRDQKLVSKIHAILLREFDEVEDYTLAAIMKMTRYSTGLKELEILYEILNKVKTRVTELSIPCLTHNIHAAAFVQYHDQELMQMVIDRFEKDIDSARLKDMDRICWALSIFDYDSKTPLYHKIIESLRQPNRKEEIAQFPLVLSTALLHLSYAGVFPNDLIQEVLEPTFLNRLYNGNMYKIGRQFWSLENNAKIEAPEYKGPFLKDNIREFLAKKYNADAEKPAKNNETNKFTVDVAHICKLILTSDTAVHIDQVLPHFVKPDLIVCLDEANNPVPPARILSKMPSGTIKYQEASCFRWIAIVLATQNQMLKGTNKFVGPFSSKLRQLKKIGYAPVAIPFNAWRDLPNQEEKQKYLRNLLPLLPNTNQKLVSSHTV